MDTRRHLLVAALSVIAAMPLNCTAAAGSWNVAVRLLHDGKAFATPGVIVKPGVPATVAVTGRDGYQLSITATSVGEGRVKVATDLGSTYGRIHPVVIVRPGQPATINVGELGIVLWVTPSGG